jgi:hypothetical protein
METKEQSLSFSKQVIRRITCTDLPKSLLEKIISDDVVEKQSIHLIPFCYSLTPAFGAVEPEDQITISAAVYMGAMGVYTLDPVLDLEISGNDINHPVSEAFLLISTSQQLLNEVIPPHSRFWKKYQTRLLDHFKETTANRRVSATDTDWNQSTYYDLLRLRYSLLYLPLDILFHLTGETSKANYYHLGEALFHFTIGFNIPNEIIGFASDSKVGLKNYAWVRLSEFLEKEHLDPGQFSLEELHKIVYLTGIATELYDEALAAFNQCLSIIRPLNLPLFEKIVHHQIKKTIKEKEGLTSYLQNIS